MDSRIIRGVALCAALLVPVFAASAQSPGVVDDPMVATVNGEAIYRSDVLEAASSLPAQYQAQLAQIYPALIERLIDMKVVALAAREAGLDDDAEVQQRLAERKLEIIRDIYLERYIGEQVTDDSLHARYDEYVAANPGQTEVNARHILLETEGDAQAVITELDGGADFATLARERSTGPSSEQGGDLGFFTQDQMVPEFAEAAFAMEVGSYSKAPVRSQFGWHVIKVEDRREQSPPPFEQMAPQLRNDLSRGVVEALLGDLRGKAEIKVLSTSLDPAAERPSGDQSGTQ